MCAGQHAQDDSASWWADAQQVITAWEEQRGRFLASAEATDLTRRVSLALKRAFDRGVAQGARD